MYQNVERWGKCNLSNGTVLSSALSESMGSNKRSQCHFEAHIKGAKKPIFGKALAFFSIGQTKECLAVYHKLDKIQKTLNVWRGTWCNEYEVMDVSNISNLIGIWTYNNNVTYVLRKHCGFDWLSDEGKGIGMEESVNEEV